MIKELATVTGLRASALEVETVSRSTCASCSARSGCGQSLLARVFGQSTSANRLWIPLSERLTPEPRVGDRVTLNVREQDLLRATVLLYLVPTVLIVAGAVGAHLLSGTDWGAIAGAVGGGLLGFFLARRRLASWGLPVQLTAVERMPEASVPGSGIAVKAL